MAKRKSSLQIEIRKHFLYPDTHWTAVVTTTRGFCYQCSWAGDRPTEEQVLKAWRTDRKAFLKHYS